jgi:hypothetical protein
MVGITPTFYKITVTASLSLGVKHGAYPSEATDVSFYVPLLPRTEHRGV